MNTCCIGLGELEGLATRGGQPASSTKGRTLGWRGLWSRWSVVLQCKMHRLQSLGLPCISWINHKSRRSFLWIKAVKADRSITLILSRFWLTWSSLCRTGLLDIQEEATTDSSASPKFYAAEAVIINFQIKSPMVKMCKMFLSPSCPTLSLTYIKYPTPPGWSVLVAEQVKI